MAADGVERAVAFSQFPQWSCTTSGSSMNELWRQLREMGLEDRFRWSLIDRWPLYVPLHPISYTNFSSAGRHVNYRVDSLYAIFP